MHFRPFGSSSIQTHMVQPIIVQTQGTFDFQLKIQKYQKIPNSVRQAKL